MSGGRDRRLRLMVAAFGDAGHAFPAIALARALKGRGHEVVVETWQRWREPVEELGLRFAAAEEYTMFPPPAFGSGDASAAEAAKALAPLLEEWRPDAVVSDILTIAPSLAAEVAGVRRATLVPHLYPVHEEGMPFFATGAMPPRTGLGRLGWRAALPLLESGLRRGRRELNEQRESVGLAPVERFHGGISEELVLVGTFPQLEYRREWPKSVEVVGPMEFELPYQDIELPAGEEPLVLVAPSTAKDPDCRLVRVALEGLADEPVRVVATTNRGEPGTPIEVPGNAALVDWLSYSQVMPRAELVVCHGGHGTVARALGAGAPVLCCPAAGDMGENAIRVAWAGVGRSLPWRLCRPGPLRWAVRRVLGDPAFRERVAELAAWRRENDGAERGAALVESFARAEA
ncbi:MAG: nucleotide disphospho-sugar-binding domain-containing protein [Actinomycetota bacterium]